MATADIQPRPTKGARRDTAVPAGGRVAAGRDSQPGDRPLVQVGAVEDVVDPVLVRHTDQPSFCAAVRDGAGKQRWRRAKVTIEDGFRLRDLPVTHHPQVGRAQLDDGLTVGLRLRDMRADDQQAGAGQAERADADARPEDGADRWPRPGKAGQEQSQEGQPGSRRCALRTQRRADLRSKKRAWLRVAGRDIDRTIHLIDGRRAPDACAGAPIRHHVGRVLHLAGRRIERNQLALDQRAVGKGRDADVNASPVEGR